jgi:hypothetical protein
LIEQRYGVPVKPRISRNVTNFELSLTH